MKILRRTESTKAAEKNAGISYGGGGRPSAEAAESRNGKRHEG